jgi:hypothetical protein
VRTGALLNNSNLAPGSDVDTLQTLKYLYCAYKGTFTAVPLISVFVFCDGCLAADFSKRLACASFCFSYTLSKHHILSKDHHQLKHKVCCAGVVAAVVLTHVVHVCIVQLACTAT